MFVRGIRASEEHDQNGMTYRDMAATVAVADKLDEVIIFRSTGPWSKRWLDLKYPSKNFHVKGKSSDWGPHAGFVPFEGAFSKVGYDPEKAQKGTKANIDGLHSCFASRATLTLTEKELRMQCELRASGRTAIARKVAIPNSRDFLLYANRSGDDLSVPFRAMRLDDGRYEIRAFSPGKTFTTAELEKSMGFPLEVMSSNEVGANNMPMTGDYDLLAVCPSMGQYGNQSSRQIRKPGIVLNGKPPLPDFVFQPGVGMDNVIDPALHTAGNAQTNYDAVNTRSLGPRRYHAQREAQLPGQEGPILPPGMPRPVPEAETETVRRGDQDVEVDIMTPYSLGRNEHPDMGNITPRILNAINELNREMGAIGPQAPFRRVHHNAESHRNARFGALTKKDMLTKKDGDLYGDGFPMTVFQPRTLCAESKATNIYTSVCTIETFDELASYLSTLQSVGFYVPKNWAWALSSSPTASTSVRELFERRARGER